MEEPQKAKARRNKWYSVHKDEPGFLDILNGNRKRYYNKNIDEERRKARERYYRRRDAVLVKLAQEILDAK
jgi:hypothetical protein